MNALPRSVPWEVTANWIAHWPPSCDGAPPHGRNLFDLERRRERRQEQRYVVDCLLRELAGDVDVPGAAGGVDVEERLTGRGKGVGPSGQTSRRRRLEALHVHLVRRAASFSGAPRDDGGEP